MKCGDVSRRVFLRESSVAAVGLCAGGALALSGCGPDGAKPVSLKPVRGRARNLSYHPKMGYRRLGKADLMVSEIVLSGCLGDGRDRHFRAASNDEEVTSEVVRNRTDVVSKCIECGINYLDITCAADARAYKAALKGRRERMYVAADDEACCMRHARHRNANSQMRNIESCLAKLGTDYLDVWRPQCKQVGGHRDIDMEMCIAVFEKARQQGKVRFLGMATQDRSWIQHFVERFGQYAVIYTSYALRSQAKALDLKSIDRDQLYEPSAWGGKRQDTGDELFEQVKARDVGVIATGPFGVASNPNGSGLAEKSLQENPELTRLMLACTLSNPDLSAVAVAMSSPSDVESYAGISFERQSGA
jgi:aryl-alcohol dehydrogenase-like predicted oxidoreductase